MQEKRRSNTTRTEEMRARLIAAARELFAERGYADASTPDIVRAADVTRGALYHHFPDKVEVFRAVVIAEAEALGAEIATAAQSARPETALEQGTNAFFNAMSQPGRARILLIDGPAVLGIDEMTRIDAGNGRATLTEGLRSLRPDLTEDALDTLGEILSAAFDRAALAVAHGGDADRYADGFITLFAALSQR